MPITPAQDHVLVFIAAGFTAAEASRQAGVHRHTIANWLKDPEFQTALQRARLTKQVLYQDEAEALVARAIGTLLSISEDRSAPPSVRLRATVAILKHAFTITGSRCALIPPNLEPLSAPPAKTIPMAKNVQSAAPPQPDATLCNGFAGFEPVRAAAGG